MRGMNHRRLIMATVAAALLSAPAVADAQRARQRWPDANVSRQGSFSQDAYDRGYRQGLREGEQDARRGRDFDLYGNSDYRDGDRGYNQRDGNRDRYRSSYRSGFESGYRTGFDNARVVRTGQNSRRNSRVFSPRGARGYQEPAYARGYSDGFEKGLDDGRDRDRYDPVRHGDYREADQGYSGTYGSKDAYKNNYRAGFRQGYDDGYRDGTRNRR